MNKDQTTDTSLAELKPFDFEKAELTEFVKDYENHVVSDETYKESLKVREKLRDRRYAIDRTLKANKAVLNSTKKKQEDMAEELLGIIVPTENKVDAGIKAIENRKAEEKAKRDKEEADRLAKIEEEKRLAMEAELQAEKDKLETIRIEQAAKEKELRDKEAAILKKQEDDRKLAEAEILKKQKAAQAEIEEREAAAKKIQDAKEAELRIREEAHQKAVQADLDKKKKEQDETEAKLREQQEAIEEEKRILQEKKDQEAAEKKAQEEAEIEAKRQAALKPDKDKLLSFASQLDTLEYPELSGEPASKKIMEQVQSTILGLQVYIREHVELI